MQLKSLSLKNIRSYPSLNLEFKTGSTMLSGDIGAGKTTILLSIEFALFGLMKGMLSGNTLLRHGCKEGNVTLTFISGKDEIKVSRSLKRTSSSVTQDSGYLEINNTRAEYTAVELKSRILSILGYPDELLTKSKSLIYRYTVYTPQEEMKQIILDDEDERLEKLTKIFNIDKYKRIRENAEAYAKELRSETKILNTLEQEFSLLETQKKSLEVSLEDRGLALQNLQGQIDFQAKKISESEQKLKEIEEAVKTHNSITQEINLLLAEQRNHKRNIDSAAAEIKSLELQKKRITEDLSSEEIKKTRELTAVNDELEEYREKKKENEQKFIEAKSRLGTLERKKEESEELKKNISSLEKCPVCQQEVGKSHKDHIAEEENKKLEELKEKEQKLKEIEEKTNKNITIIQKKIETLQVELLEIKQQEQKIVYRKKQELMLKEIEQKLSERTKNKLETETLLLECIEKESGLREKAETLLIDSKLVKEISDELKAMKDSFLKLKVEEGKNSQAIKDITKNLEENEKNTEKKKLELEKIKRKKEVEHWLSNHFVSLMDVIEKNVLASIRAEFKTYFEEWFSMLIEDESITATLDERFTPKITQNGYDTEIENLSGGEKTSVALAYRLALNKVINTMHSTIKTKDLIILDEPTDGFSSHQLDKVRDVLEALNCKQTIIVSHETKMESFVSHILRIRKHEHESGIMG
ncbi:MAG: AAA family ATPase [Candidatus Nanoarchaeia archaeon]